MNNNNTEIEKCQDENIVKELQDKFTPKKQSSELLSQSYYRLGYENKAERVSDCGTFLEYWKPIDNSSKPILHNANFCRDRLCPMCSWRRSYKIFGQVSQIMDIIGGKYDFIFLTLTVPNCEAEKLSETIDSLQSSFNKLTKYTRFKGAVKGYFKALETTRNAETETFHPHLHNILAVRKSYFTDKSYISRDEWLNMWRKATKNDDITQVDVRRCKAKENIKNGEDAVKALNSAVAEVAKYSVKSKDYLIKDNPELTDKIVMYLSSALSGRRLCSFGGCFDKIRKSLKMDDCENGDLLHLDNNKIRSDVAYMIYRYGWSCGAYNLLSMEKSINVLMECDEE